MEKPAMCRICLVQNVRMHVVVNKSLQELYETLTDVPFVTEDCRPMLACFFCCAKMKQCEEFQRKCLEAEELFSKMLNEDCESNSSINRGHVKFYGGFVKTSTELISIDDTCQTENNVIKEELPAFDDIQDDIIEPAEEILSDDHLHNDSLDSAPYHSEADSEDYVPLIKFKTEVKEEEQNHLQRDLLDSAPYHSEAESEDYFPLIKFSKFEVKIEVEEEQRPKFEEDTTRDEQKKKGPSALKIASSKSVTKLNKTVKFDQCSLNGIKKIKRNKSQNVGDKPNKCDICQRRYSRKSSLTKHIRSYSCEKPYKCDICQCDFRQKCNLIVHISSHSGEKPYKCDICQRGFSRKSYLIYHIRLHSGKKPYKCDICQYGFSRKNYLINHMRIHSGEKPYKCDICQYGFRQKCHLVDHIRIHTGENPYKCDVCPSAFIRKSALVRHIRIHSREKPYKCVICPSGFSRKGDLVRHIRVHSGEKKALQM